MKMNVIAYNRLSFKDKENIFGNNYSKRNLMFYRAFYSSFPNVSTLWTQLTYSHFKSFLYIKNENERNYYINQVILNNLSVRELRDLIKSKAYNRLSFKDKENITLIESITIKMQLYNKK